MMMTGAVAATTPASVPTDNASSKIKNPNEPDFAELLFLLLGLVPLQNLNPQDQQQQSMAQSDSIPGEVKNTPIAVVQGQNLISRGTPESPIFAATTVPSVAGQAARIPADGEIQTAGSLNAANAALTVKQDEAVPINPAGNSITEGVLPQSAQAVPGANT